MNPNKLLRLTSLYYSLASGEELPQDSDNLKTILNNLENLETYEARKKYAEANLKRLSSGSSRLVYLTKNNTVIKLASGDKGIAQNKVEAGPGMKSKYINKILNCAKNYTWIEVPFLEKITEKEFEKMTGINFKDFGEAIRYGLRDISGNSDKEKPAHFNEVSKSDIYKELKDVGERELVMPGDLARISSWGTKDGKPIIIDAGLNKNVFEKYYDDSSSS
jgi:hypothetical protein